MGSRRTPLLLGVLWFALVLQAGSFALLIGSDCPNADEWDFVPVLLNREPLGPWLWEQHNEHRLPLPRLVYHGLFQLTKDFRAGALLQVGLLAAASAWMMRLAARIRGRAHWADAFFPISLLHLGHWENLLIGYNLCFGLILFLETAIGAIALRTTRENAFRSGFLAGFLTALLCLCGGGGVVTAMPVAVWLAWLPIQERSVRRLVLLAFAAFPLVYLAIYLQGYHRPGHHPEVGEGGSRVIAVATQVLSLGFGSGPYRYWLPIGVGLAALGLATARNLLRDVKTPPARPAALGALAILAGIVGVALVIGLGRAALDPRSGVASRYSYLTWPALAIVYLLWVRRGGWSGKWVPVGLCVAAAIAFGPNTGAGMKRGTEVRLGIMMIEDEARAGSSPEAIVALFGTDACRFQRGQEARAVRAIPMLREAGIGAFAEGRP